MNLIDQTFNALRKQNKTALIPFISCGDPLLDITVDIVKQLEESGADIIELGVPYSDPLADGPVIQRASERALQNNVTLFDCIKLGNRLREAGVKLPLILFTYYNPALQFGLERFFEEIKKNDISGLIIPDLPIEENHAVMELSHKYNIHLIPLVAPTSEARINKIVQQAKGFVYCVSSLGVTGERADFHEKIDEFLATVRQASPVPIAVGFGISNREQVANFEQKCDGVIVGSAIVRTIENQLPLLLNEQTRKQGLQQIGQFVSQLKA